MKVPSLRAMEVDTGVEMEAGRTLLMHGLVQKPATPNPTESPAEPKPAGQEEAHSQPEQVALIGVLTVARHWVAFTPGRVLTGRN